MTSIQVLRYKRSKQVKLYKRLRKDYPESARQVKRNILLINKQIHIMKENHNG